jgi:hypothetical protein
MFLAAVGAVLIAWYGYRYALIAMGGFAIDRSEDFIRGGAAHIDALTPSELLDVWTKEVLAEGLGAPEQPYWVAAKAQVAGYVWWIKLGAGAVVGGVAVAFITALFGRK